MLRVLKVCVLSLSGRTGLVGGAVLALVFVFEYVQVGQVARLADEVLLHRFPYGAARFVHMGTVAILALCGVLEDFLEVVSHFLLTHVERAEALDARGVDEISFLANLEHLGEGRRVHALVVVFRYFPRPRLEVGVDGIDECRLADARVPREERDAVVEQGTDFVDAFATDGGHLVTGIADVLIEVHQSVEVAQLVVVVAVHLVEDEADGYAVGFRRGKEAVDEDGRCLGVVHRDHQETLVEVRGDDVRLLGEVGGAADDVVLPVVDGGDEGSALVVEHDVHAVAHGDGVGAPDAFQPEVPFYLAVYQPAVVRLDLVPAACVSNNESVHVF